LADSYDFKALRLKKIRKFSFYRNSVGVCSLSLPRLRSQRFCDVPYETNVRESMRRKNRNVQKFLLNRNSTQAADVVTLEIANQEPNRPRLPICQQSRRRAGATGRAQKPRRQSRPLSDPASSPSPNANSAAARAGESTAQAKGEGALV
jgi:hypothetical protein